MNLVCIRNFLRFVSCSLSGIKEPASKMEVSIQRKLKFRDGVGTTGANYKVDQQKLLCLWRDGVLWIHSQILLG